MTQQPDPLSEPLARNDFRLGFSSLRDEVDVPELTVRGALPDWLAGTLLRNGPALFEAGDRSFRHWFDGQAMLHRFEFADGRVSYRNRFLRTASYRAAREDGTIRFGEFATDPCRSIFARVFAGFRRRPTPNAAVNLAPVGDGEAALGETALAVRFAPDTLATVGLVDYADDLAGQVTTAHPHRAPGSGDLVNQLLRFGRRSQYQVYRQRPGSPTRELIGVVPADLPGYLHSFGITERYAVLAVFPLVVNPLTFLLRGRAFIENYRWRPELGTRFVVLDLADGSVRADLRAEACFAFHHINAFEDGDDLVVDLAAYPDAEVVAALHLDRVRRPGELPLAHPTRYRLDLAAGTVRAHRLVDEPVELPTIAYSVHNGRSYRFAYGVGAHGGRDDDFYNQLVKLDVVAGTARTWHEPGCYPGEPVFVPSPGGSGEDGAADGAAEDAAEDAGVVLSVVLDGAAGRSFLLVLDAGTFTEVARAEVPHAIPFGFHGRFRRS